MDDRKLIVRVPIAIIDRFRSTTKEKSHNQSALVREWITDYLARQEEYKLYGKVRKYFSMYYTLLGGNVKLSKDACDFIEWCVKSSFENESFWNFVFTVSVNNISMDDIDSWIDRPGYTWVVGSELDDFQNFVSSK